MFNPVIAFALHIICQLLLSADVSCETFIDAGMPEQTVLPEGYTAFPDVGVAYKYYNYSRAWNLARKDCAAREAHLAVVDSFTKIDYLIKLKNNDSPVWTGVHRLFDGVEWVSAKTASTLTTIPWASNENGIKDPGEECACLWGDGRGLSPVLCNMTYHFVCEIELQSMQKPIKMVILML